jgi:2-polyprenyl-3-methyl-5-hydroxy-6-metoxy-1,4-benzoquinol methylase
MSQQPSSSLLESIRDQFNFGPYPHHSVEETTKDNFNALYTHSLVTPYYLRNQRVLNTENAVILDAGCGTGYKALTLSYANPGAKIVGIDISEKSVELARQRFAYQGRENCEFHVLGIDQIAQLGMEFDYINCDEVLYLFPNPAVGLQALKSVLKPEGLIRSNLHSLLQRNLFFRAQEVFRMMGLMDDNPEDLEIQIVAEVIEALRQGVELKAVKSLLDDTEDNHESFKSAALMNLLFQGDRGFTITDMFQALRESDLEFVSMVNWRRWDVVDLFQNRNNLPEIMARRLPESSAEEKLRLYELINPVNRLLDFWCGHPGQTMGFQAVNTWESTDWQTATVHIHPILQHDYIRKSLARSAQLDQPCHLNAVFNETTPGQKWTVESTIASTLLPLLDGPQPVTALVDRYLKVRSVDPVTLAPFSPQVAFDRLTSTLKALAQSTYVLIER